MTVGGFLRSWRLAAEMSQKAFARKLKLSPANLCDIEKGRKGVSPEKAHEIAAILGYSRAVLVKIALVEQGRREVLGPWGALLFVGTIRCALRKNKGTKGSVVEAIQNLESL